LEKSGRKNTLLYVMIAIALVISCISFFASSHKQGGAQLKKGYSSPYYKDELKVKYSKSFEIEYYDSAKIIRVFTPDSARTLIYQYLLLPNGVNVPSGYGAYQIIRTPVKSVISLTSIYIGFLEKLDLLDKLIAVDNFQFINSEKVKELIKEKRITEVGETANLNIEKVISINPGLLLTYGNGNPTVDGHQKLIQNGVLVASSTSHLENAPLARAEWIKFVAAFFDKEKKANEIFDSVEYRYNKLKTLAGTAKNKPTVFTDAVFIGKWYEPGGASFAAQLLKDAGADYIWKDNNSTGSLKLNYEQVLDKAYNADFWINVHFWNKISDVVKEDPRNAKFKAYQTKNIYNNNAIMNEYGGNEYWESGVINIDIVLADLIKIFHPDLLPEHNFKYYKKLADE
jgi:iron complex transport system substrate-binding protein